MRRGIFVVLKGEKVVLIIEDSFDDAILIRRALSGYEGCRTFLCRNISEARAYLTGAGMYSDRSAYPMPTAVLSDLWLGAESANDFLKWIKMAGEFKGVPVYVMTGAASPRATEAAASLGAEGVLLKSPDIEELKLTLAVVMGGQ